MVREDPLHVCTSLQIFRSKSARNLIRNQRKNTGCFAVYVIIFVRMLRNSRTKNVGILQCFIIVKTCVHKKKNRICVGAGRLLPVKGASHFEKA